MGCSKRQSPSVSGHPVLMETGLSARGVGLPMPSIQSLPVSVQRDLSESRFPAYCR